MSVERLRTVWETLGETDPLWAVYSEPEHKDGGWDLDEFMATGVRNVAWLHRKLAEFGLEFGERLLDFGCGVGRLSCAFAERGHQVDGVDLSRSMIELAQRYNRVGERARFQAYDGWRLPFEQDAFDAAVSIVVFQHCPPSVQVTALVELLRVVRSGGLVVFQVPIAPRIADPLPETASRARLWLVSELPESLPGGRSANLTVEVTNDGDAPWPQGSEILLGNHWRRGEELLVQDDGRAQIPETVRPGERVSLELTVTPPVEAGEYTLELDMVQELVRWFADAGSPVLRLPISVTQGEPPAPAAQPEDPDRGIEMHPMPDSLVRELVQHCGARVLHALPDNFAGEPWHSRTYFIRR